MVNINNFSFSNNYIKPVLSPIDVDIDLLTSKSRSKCSVFNMIINKDYSNLKNYSSSSYIQTNTNRQTPLMLACKIGDPLAAKILLNEAGIISLNHKTAIDYARENGNKEIIDMLSKYEF